MYGGSTERGVLVDPLVHHAGLASGRFTLMFTDIEGSTSLIYRLGDRYPAVLEQHHHIIVDAVTAAGGVPVGTEGDAFFVVFDDPGNALCAALAIDRGLIGATWPDGLVVRVRIGLHTGDAIAT